MTIIFPIIEPRLPIFWLSSGVSNNLGGSLKNLTLIFTRTPIFFLFRKSIRVDLFLQMCSDSHIWQWQQENCCPLSEKKTLKTNLFVANSYYQKLIIIRSVSTDWTNATPKHTKTKILGRRHNHLLLLWLPVYATMSYLFSYLIAKFPFEIQ